MEDAAVEISESHTTDMAEDKTTEQTPDEKERQNLTTEEVDLLLDKCLLQALYTSIKEKDLPMPGSTLWYIFLLQFTYELTFHLSN